MEKANTIYTWLQFVKNELTQMNLLSGDDIISKFQHRNQNLELGMRLPDIKKKWIKHEINVNLNCCKSSFREIIIRSHHKY
jgi:hypothetical protein